MNAPVTTLELITSYIDDIAPINPTITARLNYEENCRNRWGMRLFSIDIFNN